MMIEKQKHREDVSISQRDGIKPNYRVVLSLLWFDLIFFSLWWCESDRYSMESILWIVPGPAICSRLSHDARAASANAAPSQPHGHEGKQQIHL